MTKALFKDILRSIARTKNRFITIFLIASLGVAVFAGIKVTAPDLKDTAARYFLRHNLMDINVISTIGLSDKDVQNISQISGVAAVMPSKTVDAFIEVDGKKVIDVEGAQYSCRAMSLDLDMLKEWQEGVNDAAYMNRVRLVEGVYPKNPDECLIDHSDITSTHRFKIGDVIKLVGDNENLGRKLTNTEFKVVGIVNNPLYVSAERGNSLIGSGKLGNYIYVPSGNFVADYYTNVFVSVAGAFSYSPFSKQYKEDISKVIEEISAISDKAIKERSISLQLEYSPQVVRGEEEYVAKKLEAELKLAEAREQVKQVKYYAEHGEEELAAKKAEYENSLSQAQKELFSGKSQYNAGLAEYNRKLAEYNAAKAIAAKYPNAREDYEKAGEELKKAKEDIDRAERSLTRGKKLLEELKKPDNTETLSVILSNLAKEYPEYKDLIEQAGTQGLPNAIIALEVATITGDAQLANAKQRYEQGKVQYDLAGERIKELDKLADAEKQLNEAKSKLQAGSSDIAIGELTLNMKQMELKYELTLAEEKLAQAKANVATVDEQYAKAEADAQEQLQNARYDLDAGRKMLDSLDNAMWHVEGRESLPGNLEYERSADNMDAFAAVFPVFFFFIAAAVCLSTMTRMVKEERTQLGTLKALGYTSAVIAVKYLVYAFLASAIGSILGIFVGFYLFPRVIYEAYSIMFTTPDLVLSFSWKYALIGFFVMIGSVMAAALFAARKDLMTDAARLMRPVAPKKGKRIFLERFGFVWKRLSFNSKVTLRNMMRNKRRLAMTVTGIAGCTALIVVGMGIDDSISAISANQFGNNSVMTYDAQVVLNDKIVSGISEGKTLEAIKGDSRVDSAMLTYMKSYKGGSEREEELLPVSIIVPQNNEQLSDFINLKNRESGEVHNLTDEGVIVTEKFASHTKSKIGDKVFVQLEDKQTEIEMTVAGIVENYAFHYVYMSEAVYNQAFGTSPDYSFATIKLAPTINSMETSKRDAERSKLAADLMKREDINVVVYVEQAVDAFNGVLSGLDTLTRVFVIGSVILALLVLYNLANININERLRDIASIKVLGFLDREVVAYIFKESIYLTLLGIIFGLLAAVPLHLFVIKVAEINILMYGRSIDLSSYLFATGVIIIFSVLVAVLMSYKLKRVDMVETLKVVE